MGLLSLTVNRQIAFVSGFLNLARIHVHSRALYARHPQVCSACLHYRENSDAIVHGDDESW
jgi:hypothetical protein